jgi:hypothetical protein
MNIFQKIFGKQKTDTTIIPRTVQEDGAPPLRINPALITHAFIALTHKDIKHADKLPNKIAAFNKSCQPLLWDKEVNAKFMVFTVNSVNDFPDPDSIKPALESAGIESPYTVVINYMSVSFDGGRTPSNIFTGFAYSDKKPKFIMARNNGCVSI